MKRIGLAIVLVAALLIAITGVVLVLARRGPAPQPGPGPAAIEASNRAAGLMGMYRFAEALGIYEQLLAQHPQWHEARVNLAIATLNRQAENDSERALEIIQGVLAEDPGHLRARYCAGLLTLYLGDPAGALEHFRFVAERDPADAYAAYYVGQCYRQDQAHAEAARWFEQAHRLDPYLRSACYALAQTYQRLERADEAQSMLDLFKGLDGNPRARLVDFIYTRMGPRSEVLAVDLAPPPRVEPPAGPVFGAAEIIALHESARWRSDRPARPLSMTAGDASGDGMSDLFVSAALEGERGRTRNAVLVRSGDGRLVHDPVHVLADIEGVNAALWGDIDDDGLEDVYLCRRGPNRLFRQTAPGAFEDVTASTGTGGAPLDTVDGALFDADHDGDLDIFCANGAGPCELFSNNRDGTFRPIAQAQGIAGDGRSARQVLSADLDGDRDADIIVIKDEPPHEAYVNDRLWRYRPASGLEEFVQRPCVAAAAADLDADGRIELLGLDAAGGIALWRRGDDGSFRAEALRPSGTAGAAGAASHVTVADVTGDGQLDVFMAGQGGWSAVSIAGAGLSSIFDEPAAAHGWALISGAAPQHGPALVAATTAGLTMWPPGPGRFQFATVELSGRHDAAAGPPPMRSNRSGIGTRLAARVDSRWTVLSTFRSGSGPGQSREGLSVGLGGHPRIDFLAIDWSDGVRQSEVHAAPYAAGQPPRDFSPGHVERIAEVQRQSSSCPVIFAWNGERYEFVSDILGVGGMGFLVSPGAYAEPRPWERFMMPQGMLAPRDGRSHVKIGEPMEEACYLDAARLVAWDLPPGWSMTLDERFAVLGPAPSGESRFYRRMIQPLAVTNERGEDVTESVLHADQRAAPLTAHDHRFIGRLAADHVLTLEFAEPIDAAGTQAPCILIADGWIEYPYSQTMFAAWQAGAEYRAPTIEARAGDGPWRVVLEQFGYPAGMPRQMSVPLDGLPRGTTALRISSNQEIYWDRLAIAFPEACPQARRHELPLAAAEVRRRGFAHRPPLPQRLPYYDYSRRAPFWDTRHQAGRYTRFGPAEELVAAADGALAIIGPGEEIHLEFADHPPPPPSFWTRRFVLEAHGWCKDMDLATRDGDSLEPLPGPPSPNRDRLHALYNTRPMSGP